MLHAYEWNLEILWEDCDEWEDTGYSGLTLEEEKTSKQDIVLKNANFTDVMRYMKRTSIPCFHVDYTLFKHEPFIRYHRRYYMQEDEKLFKNDIKNISIRMIYQKKKITLQELFEEFPAEQAIQYIKERGLSVCPYGVEK